MKLRFRVYEYPANDKKEKPYNGSYTIREGAKPAGYKGEHLVGEFELDL